MSGYRFKGQEIIINGVRQTIVPSPLPSSPTDGLYAVDEADGKLKVYNETKARWIVLGDAEDQVFDNSTNGFVADNTQAAIEETKNSSVSSLITFEYWNNGTSSNTWLNTAGSPHPSDNVPRIVPVRSKLVGVTFTNANDDVDLDIRVVISKYGEGSAVNRTIIYELRDKRTYRNFHYDNLSSNLILDAGDKVSVYIKDEGGNPNDPVVTLYLKTLDESNGILSENFSSDFSVTLGPITIILG